MAVLKILNYGDPLLRKKAEKVHKVSAKIQKLIDDMFDTMYANNGVGLAANQVGELKRIFVLDCSSDEESMPQMVFINPVIIKKIGAIVSREGCLSFPGVYTDVKRYEKILVRFMDVKGKTKTVEIPENTLLCRAIQHELDHLDGVLFVDHVIDRFGTDQLLSENQLPPIEADFIVDEPELDSILSTANLTPIE